MGYLLSLGQKRRFILITLIVFVILILYAVLHTSLDRPEIKSTSKVKKIEPRPIDTAKLSDRSQPLIIRKKIIPFSERRLQKEGKPQLAIVRKKIIPPTASDPENITPYSEIRDFPGSVATPTKDEALEPKTKEIPSPIAKTKAEPAKLSTALESNKQPLGSANIGEKKQYTEQKVASENKTANLLSSDKMPKRKIDLADAKTDDSSVITPIETESGAFKTVSLNPYSIMLSSCRLWESVDKLLAEYRIKGLSPYFVKVDLGERGIWWRILLGYYQTREEAFRIREEIDVSGSLVVNTPYANLINNFSSEADATTTMVRLEELQYSPYVIKRDTNTYQLLVGAFITKDRAVKQKIELLTKGIPNKVIER